MGKGILCCSGLRKINQLVQLAQLNMVLDRERKHCGWREEQGQLDRPSKVFLFARLPGGAPTLRSKVGVVSGCQARRDGSGSVGSAGAVSTCGTYNVGVAVVGNEGGGFIELVLNLHQGFLNPEQGRAERSRSG
jgi:hypothetical protein